MFDWPLPPELPKGEPSPSAQRDTYLALFGFSSVSQLSM